MTATEKTFAPREFVYTGLRYGHDKKLRISIRVIGPDGALGDEMWFPNKRGYAKTLGHVYTCDFSEDGGTVQGLRDARWVRTWAASEDLIAWEATDGAAATADRRAKMEAEKGRISEIEAILTPLRKVRDGYTKRGDLAGRRALEEAVLAALRTPLRTFEGDGK